MADPWAGKVYWRVERLHRDGTWRQISPEGMGGLERNRELFHLTMGQMRRGAIRLVNDRGGVEMEHHAGVPA